MLAVTEFWWSNTFCVIWLSMNIGCSSMKKFECFFEIKNVSPLFRKKLMKVWSSWGSSICIMLQFWTLCKIQCLLTINRIVLWGKCIYLLFFFNIIHYPACFSSLWSIIREIKIQGQWNVRDVYVLAYIFIDVYIIDPITCKLLWFPMQVGQQVLWICTVEKSALRH